ncbi:hypothetical protein SS50377_24340 [Spironucleus salmonicida]|uniref:Uncharacterized protein n=1 Tax=Spironucleus salmonicida TaxID=348837 RepID=V6LPD9_9EUKA|nr:hypothetical protein SS50377_24340 [Spironucleus salmonicida]|eukprot:EST46108.1 Hypothetical protein SS50377_14102 [Spironucleus salmonicida]
MPSPSIFLSAYIKELKLDKCMNVDKADRSFIQNIDQARHKAIQCIESSQPIYVETLEKIDIYLQQLASYLSFTEALNTRKDQKEFDKTFSKIPQFSHQSIVNQNKSEFHKSVLDEYFFHFYYLATAIDSQLFSFNQDILKTGLARLDYIRIISHKIVAEEKSGIELRTEFLDVLEYLLNALLLLSGALKAEQANATAYGEPKFNYKSLAGIYGYALQEAEKSHLVLTKLTQKEKKISKDLQKFVCGIKNLCEIGMLTLMILEYEVFQCNYRESQQQSLNIRNRLAECVQELYQIQFSNTKILDFFTVNFGHKLQEGVSNQQIGTQGNIVRFPLFGSIKRGSEFMPFEPLWTDLRIK